MNPIAQQTNQPQLPTGDLSGDTSPDPTTKFFKKGYLSARNIEKIPVVGAVGSAGLVFAGLVEAIVGLAITVFGLTAYYGLQLRFKPVETFYKVGIRHLTQGLAKTGKSGLNVFTLGFLGNKIYKSEKSDG